MANLDQLGLPNGSTYNFKDNTQERSDHRHYDSDMVPLVHKLYESSSYYATANDYANASWYFMSVVPDAWYKPWRVDIKIHSYCPSYGSYESYTWSTLCGRADSLIYANWNERYNSAHSYIVAYPLKKAGFDAGYGHAIGISIYNADSRTSSGYYRSFEIDYFYCENCTVTILDTPVKWADWAGTGSTNYGTLAAYDAINRGLRETGDDNTVTENRIGNFAGKTGVQGVWAGSLFMEDANGTYQNICTASDGTATASNRTTATTKIPNSNGFKVLGTIWYCNTNYNANTNISGGSVVYSAISAFDSRYAFNTTLTANSLTPYKEVYLVGTINVSDGLFYLDPVWWTQTPNDTSKIYVLVGACYDSSTSYCRVTLYEQNKWFRYDGTNLIEIINDVIVCKSFSATPLATLPDSANNVPMKSLTVNIVPKETGTGTKSPSNPYTISGSTEIKVVQAGKNIFNPVTVLNAYLNSTGVIKSSVSTRLVYARINPNTTYTVSKQAGQRFQVAYCDSLPEAELQCSGMISNGTASSITITTGATAQYIVAFVYHSSYDTVTPEQMLATIQIEQGLTATTYEPYSATTHTIALGQTVYGGEVDVVSGQGEVTLGIVDMGSLNWIYSEIHKWFYNYTLGILSGSLDILSPIYAVKTVAELSGDLTINNAISINGTSIVVRNLDYTDANTFKTAMSGIMLVYPLATPTPISTTPTAIKTTGYDNVSADCGDVEGEYYTDTPIVYAMDDISKKNNTDTTYSLTQDALDGHKITLTPSSGTAQTITIPDNNTWRGVNVNGTALLGTSTGTGAVNFKSGTNCTVSGSGNDITFTGPTVPTSASSSTTGITVSDHTTTTVYGVQSTTTTASKVTLGTAFSIPNVTGNSDVTVPKAATSATTVPIKNTSATSIPNVTNAGSGSFTSGAFSGGSGSFTATVTNGVLSFSHTHTAATHGADTHVHTPPTLGTAISIIGVQSTTTSVTGVSGSTTASKVTLGTAFSVPNVTGATDVTVPIKNASTTTVVTSKTHTVNDSGHTHTLS